MGAESERLYFPEDIEGCPGYAGAEASGRGAEVWIPADQRDEGKK